MTSSDYFKSAVFIESVLLFVLLALLRVAMFSQDIIFLIGIFSVFLIFIPLVIGMVVRKREGD